jgi:hypothetical protein
MFRPGDEECRLVGKRGIVLDQAPQIGDQRIGLTDRLKITVPVEGMGHDVGLGQAHHAQRRIVQPEEELEGGVRVDVRTIDIVARGPIGHAVILMNAVGAGLELFLAADQPGV